MPTVQQRRGGSFFRGLSIIFWATFFLCVLLGTAVQFHCTVTRMHLLQGQIEQQERYCAKKISRYQLELTYLERLVNNNQYIKFWLLPESEHCSLVLGENLTHTIQPCKQSMRVVLGDSDFHYNKNKWYRFQISRNYLSKRQRLLRINSHLVVSFQTLVHFTFIYTSKYLWLPKAVSGLVATGLN